MKLLRPLITILALTQSVAHGKPPTPFDHTHKIWREVLSESVSKTGATTVVDYRMLKSNPTKLNSYLKQLEGVSHSDFQAFSKKNQLAFLINAYNAYTVRLIIDHYPVKSIKKTGGFFTSPWKKKFFKLFGEPTHLDHIEHDLIRKNFKEPRIHFAVNCASKGCPSLIQTPYLGAKIDEQLEAASRDFLNDKSRNRFDPKKSTLYLSKIFDWYGDDFVKANGSVIGFVAPRLGISPKDVSRTRFLDYDWSLNEREKGTQ